jgi:uncharacterized protein (DUF488 family)
MTAGPDRPVIFTLGHGDRDLPEFLDCLVSFGIEVAADVRSWPESRRHPRFDRDLLEAAIAGRGLRYRWLGDGLGGLRSKGFLAHMETRLFSDSLRHLEEMARESPVAIFCAERHPAECHRRHIAAALGADGFLVHHIEAPHHLYPEPGDGAGQPTLFPL